ncbi:hypothetical protein ACYSNM_04790 [Myroides sp. LJL116]
MNRWNSYIKFLYKSGNQHGLHSPFVYGLLTKGLYHKEPKYKGKKKKKVFVNRILSYLKVQTLCVLTTEHINVKGVDQIQSQLTPLKRYDAILIQRPSSIESITVKALLQAMHNDSVVILDKTKGSKSNDLWYRIKKDPGFTATIDFYYFGLAFKRTEQLKQHFILRM